MSNTPSERQFRKFQEVEILAKKNMSLSQPEKISQQSVRFEKGFKSK